MQTAIATAAAETLQSAVEIHNLDFDALEEEFLQDSDYLFEDHFSHCSCSSQRDD